MAGPVRFRRWLAGRPPTTAVLPAPRAVSKNNGIRPFAFARIERCVASGKQKSSHLGCPEELLQAEAVRPARRLMTKTAASPILHVIRRVVEDQRHKELPDQELLRRFRTGRDEAAFST